LLFAAVTFLMPSGGFLFATVSPVRPIHFLAAQAQRNTLHLDGSICGGCCDAAVEGVAASQMF